jgi:hypothetical protein
MVDIKYEHFQKRRQEKLSIVTHERELIINRLSTHAAASSQLAASTATVTMPDVEAEGERLRAGILEMEHRRTLSIRKRQEKEVQRAIESEARAAELQVRISHMFCNTCTDMWPCEVFIVLRSRI